MVSVNAGTQEAEELKFKANLSYIARPCLNPHLLKKGGVGEEEGVNLGISRFRVIV